MNKPVEPVPVTLPTSFAEDRLSRDLPIGEGKWTSRGFKTILSPDVFAEMLSDAEYYADPHGPDMLPPGLRTSAKATVMALRKAQERVNYPALKDEASTSGGFREEGRPMLLF